MLAFLFSEPHWCFCIFFMLNYYVNNSAGTPYENGVFRMKLLLSHDFPQSPPKGAKSSSLCISYFKLYFLVLTLYSIFFTFSYLISYFSLNVIGYFLTKIFHPNISTNGEICVNTLKKDWNPSLGLRHVLIVSQE
jgi:ubiquitin-conjugating enzyme E2 S